MTIDLSTQWLGLDLASPLVASSGPLTGNLDSLRRLEDAGIAAVVLPSIFEEQVEEEAADAQRAEPLGDDVPARIPRQPRSDAQLELLQAARACLDIPVIASLNGHTTGGWIGHARKVEAAGADALELNLYEVPADIRRPGGEIEREGLELTHAVRSETALPLAVKISPFFSSPGHMASQLVEAGANGLTLFNRFVQPDIDLDALAVEPRIALSSSDESRLTLRWIALLRGRIAADLGATSGVHQASDVLKLLLAGADVTMMTSALLKYGPSHVETVRTELEAWMESRGYASVAELKGLLSQANCSDPDAYERAQYIASLTTHVWRAGW